MTKDFNELVQVFDDEAYLIENPDVKDHVLHGYMQSGFEHYDLYGRTEGRKAPLKQISLSHLQNRIAQIEKKLELKTICDNFADVSQKIGKDPSIVFYTPRHFEGNLKYAYLEMIRHIRGTKTQIECHFLTLHEATYQMLVQHGLPVLLWRSNNSNIVKRLLKTAVIVDDGFFLDGNPNPPVLYATLSGACRINLWHGTPIKKIHLQELEMDRKIDLHLSTILKSAVNNDIFCAASPNHSALFYEAMKIKEYVVTGYARNDVLLRDIVEEDLINVDELALSNIRRKKSTHKIVVYAPTWRDGNPRWMANLDLNRMANSLDQKKLHLVVNPHPFEFDELSPILKDMDNITIIKKNTDVYPILKISDILISDYSSLVFDFILMRKPVVYFRPDHENYLANSRMLIEERLDAIPGLISETIDECVEAVEKSLKEKLNDSRWEKAIQYANYYSDDRSSSRTCKKILNSLNQILNLQSSRNTKQTFLDEA